MKTLNVASARNRFSQLVDEVHESGEGVIVAKYGHPFVMIVPVVSPQPVPQRYPLRGLPYRVAEDFDDPLPELASMVLARRFKSAGAILLEGIKWCGKTTTCEQLSKSVIYMDSPTTR